MLYNAMFTLLRFGVSDIILTRFKRADELEGKKKIILLDAHVLKREGHILNLERTLRTFRCTKAGQCAQNVISLKYSFLLEF